MSEDKSPLDEHAAAEDSALENTQESSNKPVPPVVALGFVIIALLGVLIVMGIKGGLLAGSSGSSEELTKLKAEVDARRNEINRQRISMGLSPLAEGSEPIENIAKRLKTDTDTLVALTGRFQEMLGEKDNELAAKNAEILRSEQLRQTLSGDNARLQSEVSRALAGGSDAERLRGDLAKLKSERDNMAAELNSTVEKLKTTGAGVSEGDYADLKRRFDETLRAKEFFEARVHELEGAPAK